MHSSISNSKTRVPSENWLPIWLGAALITLSVIVFFEANIRSLNWRPSLADSKDLWSEHRYIASQGKPLALVGASRIQLGLDVALAEQVLSRRVVQLAIDGSNFYPVLLDLMEDKTFNGDILLSINSEAIKNIDIADRALEWIDYYNNNSSSSYSPYRLIEKNIEKLIQENLVTRLEGATPFTVIKNIAIAVNNQGNYLTLLENRTRRGDYSMVEMPGFYYVRVGRHTKVELNWRNYDSWEQLDYAYLSEIEKKVMMDRDLFVTNWKKVLGVLNKLKAKGVIVTLVRMPTDKLIWKYDQKVTPKGYYWSRIEEDWYRSVHFKDYPELSSFDLPDGSHISQKDQSDFTKKLLEVYKTLDL